MAELLKSESPVSQSLQDITEALKIVVDDGSKAAKLVCLNERNELVPLLTQNSFVPDFRVRHEGLNPFKEGANKQVISSQADSLIKISRIWADFFPANTSNQPI